MLFVMLSKMRFCTFVMSLLMSLCSHIDGGDEIILRGTKQQIIKIHSDLCVTK